MLRIASVVASIALATTLSFDGALAQAVDGRLKNILASKTIKIAYRTDGAPFSFLNSQQQPTGYIVDICKSVVSSLEKQFNVRGNLKIEWVPVTPQTRFQTVASGKADMECGASTVTLGRMKQVDFSNFVFVESTGVIAKTATGASKFADLGGKKIAVIAGTTNEQVIKTKLQQLSLDATAVSFRSRDEAVAALDGGSVDAFASDKLLLLGAPYKDATSLRVLPDDLSFEGYGLVLPRGDATLRQAVNAAISHIFRSGEIQFIFGTWFTPLGLKPGYMLEAMFLFSALPD